MAHHPVTVLEDGTRVYSNWFKYKPIPLEERKYKIRKPDDPGAVNYHGEWFLPLAVIDDDDRELPETRPDTDAYDHMGRVRKCPCHICHRPGAKRWQDKWLRDRGLKP